MDFLPDLSAKLPYLAKAIIPGMIGIICHEVAHGWAAYRLGDNTAKFLGRLTLNPARHFEASGVGVFVLTALFTPFLFGWAKPVPVRPQFFKNPSQGMMLVSAAGPVTNFLVALFFALLAKTFFTLGTAQILPLGMANLLIEVAVIGVMVNVTLAWFNLLPIPPLDGSHIIEGLLPRQLAAAYSSIGRFGMIILVLLIVSGFFSQVLWPVIQKTYLLFLNIMGF